MLDNQAEAAAFNPAMLFLLIVAAACVIFLVLATVSTAWRRSRARTVARSLGLALPAAPHSLERRVTRTLQGTTAGALACSLAALLYLWLLGSAEFEPGSTWAFIAAGAIFVGAALGAAVAATTTRPEPVEGVRVARMRAVSLADFSAPIERHGARAAVAVAVIAAVVTTWLAGTGIPSLTDPLGIVWLAATVAVLSLVLFEVASRRIIARPQPAGSPEQLAWDDALRAWNIRALATASIAVGVYTPLIAALMLSSDAYSARVPEWVLAATFVTITIVLLVYVVLAIVSLATKPQQHYLRRLWPEVSAQAAQTAVPAGGAQ